MIDPYPAALRDLVRRAVARSVRRLRGGAPMLAAHAQAWMRALAHGAAPEEYFLRVQAFPVVLLPWWLDTRINLAPSLAFQRDVVYSTINGYYFVRLIDDVMDADQPVSPAVLPALTFFHSEFEQIYFRYFPSGHPFWSDLRQISLMSSEMASVDAGLAEIDRNRFLAVSARKVAGAKVPISAVCHRYGRVDLLEPWFELVDGLGRWHQMLNDIQGWSRDLQSGHRTYFLCQAERRAGSREAVATWVVHEGLGWGIAELEAWMNEMDATARRLDCPPLDAYLAERRRLLARDWQALVANLDTLRELAAAFR